MTDFTSPVQLSVMPPIMGQEQFASFCGTTKDTVRGWVQNETVPSVKMGKQRFVNVTALQEDLKRGKEIFQSGDYSDR